LLKSAKNVNAFLFWHGKVDPNGTRWTASYARRAAKTIIGILNEAFSLAVNDFNAVNSLPLWTNPHTFSCASALFLIDKDLRHLASVSEELLDFLVYRQLTDKIILIKMECQLARSSL